MSAYYINCIKSLISPLLKKKKKKETTILIEYSSLMEHIIVLQNILDLFTKICFEISYRVRRNG